MLKYSRILGVKVFNASEGKMFGSVQDILLDLERKSIMSICTQNKREKHLIGLGSINFVDGRVTIKDRNVVKSPEKNIQQRHNYINGKDILGKKIFTYRGENIGYLNDLIFDIEVGSLDAFEITDGIIQDIISGRNVVPAIGKISLGEEGIILSKEAVEEMIESKKGLGRLLFNK